MTGLMGVIFGTLLVVHLVQSKRLNLALAAVYRWISLHNLESQCLWERTKICFSLRGKSKRWGEKCKLYDVTLHTVLFFCCQKPCCNVIRICELVQFMIQGNNKMHWEVFDCISKLGIYSQARKNNWMWAALWCEILDYYLLTLCSKETLHTHRSEEYIKNVIRIVIPALHGGRPCWLCDWTMCFPSIVSVYVYNTGICSSLAVGRSYFDADKVCRTFANIIVDLVSRGAPDQSLAYETPHRIHAVLIGLAGVCRQTLVYVCCHRRKVTKVSALGVKRRTEQESGRIASERAAYQLRSAVRRRWKRRAGRPSGGKLQVRPLSWIRNLSPFRITLSAVVSKCKGIPGETRLITKDAARWDSEMKGWCMDRSFR